MKTKILKYTVYVLCILSAFSIRMKAQEIQNDTFCIYLNDFSMGDITSNDAIGSDGANPTLVIPSECFDIKGGKLVFGARPELCCGETLELEYTYEGYGGPPGIIVITLKCPKPDCSFVDLDDIIASDSLVANMECINTCENSIATYFVSYNPSHTYTWTVLGGSSTLTINPATIEVDWGAVGSGTIYLDDFNGITTTSYEFCINILLSPIADFAPLDSCACLSSPIAFINNSTGASSYYWDFGDGTFSNAYEPTHTYTSAGVYTVSLYVTSVVTDKQGTPLCCCTDVTSVQIEIDPKPGPNIYWISTMCPGDSTKYWTDAVGCIYNWSVADADGNTVSYTGGGNDTICVVWADGPYGVVSLQLSGCPTYCDKPVSALVPIISSVGDISGDVIVCEFSTHNYELPKWSTVTYDWTVTAGGYIASGQGTHNVNITWGTAGPGTIHVEYQSDFLNGLPNHENDECSGVADLNVNIKPEYTLFPPNKTTYCVGDTVKYAISHPANLFNWDIDPSLSVTTLADTASFVVPSTGSYSITVYPIGLNPFCNDTSYHFITVVDLVVPDGIDGPMDICPGGNDIYFGSSATDGVGFVWSVQGGTPAIDTGSFINITWNATGPYIICLSQFDLNDPGCQSDTICKTLNPISIAGPLNISGPSGCVDEIKTYSLTPLQHPYATYNWTLSDPMKGSVITDPNSSTVDIQWNNMPGTCVLTASVMLCDDTLTLSNTITIYPRPTPNITQDGDLCLGNTINLDANATGTYLWSNGATWNPISISTPGLYIVTVTDPDSCSAITTYEVFTVDGPTAFISSPDENPFCTGTGATVVMHTLANPNYTYDWYCNGILQTGPNQSYLPHYDHDSVSTWLYYVIVTDTTTGCYDQSINYFVSETECSGGDCSPQSYTLDISNMNQTPYCNNVDFTLTSSNVSFGGWNFDDYPDNSFTGTFYNPTHIYNEAKYYSVTITGTVPNTNAGGPDCAVYSTTSVCIPLAADFDYSIDCKKVSFTDNSSYLGIHAIGTWAWSYGDGGSSTNQDDMHTYATGGSYNVSLTITDTLGCTAIYTETINVYGDPSPTIIATPDPVCEGDAIAFSTSGGGAIIAYDWTFGDGSGNGDDAPSHTYLSDGTFPVSLTVTDVNGCQGTVSTNVFVYPAPIEDVIVYSPSLIVCNGETVTLTAPTGTSHIWSNGETTNVFTTDTSGVFSVEVFDVNGCSYTTLTVEVTVLPPLDATIFGDTVICDNGCVLLSAPSGYAYTYQWKDELGNDIPFAINQTFEVCDYSFHPMVSVVVTDENGCTATDNISISIEVSPTVGIDVVGTLCAGDPNVLTANPILPNVVYNWSTGATSTSITVFLAGTYTLTGRDTLTGCSSSAIAVVNPLPDLCIIPMGCYEICNPDTLCGPPGLESYQWNKNGVPLAGEINQCLYVMSSGSYSLTAENSFHCFNTSDTLILEVIPCCDDEDTDVIAKVSSTGTDGCCYELSYINSFSNAAGLKIHTSDGDITFASVDPAVNVFATGTDFVTLTPTLPATFLPTGTLSPLIDICMNNATTSPAMVLIDWLDSDFEVICQDTVWFDCPAEPDCVYLANDSIYCVQGTVLYDMEICNPASSTMNIGYIVLSPLTPLGVTITPSNIDLAVSPLLPGECRDFTVTIGGPSVANHELCFNMIGHEFNPNEVENALCCSVDTTYCVWIPGCGPCDSLFVEAVIPLEEDSCCYNITLNNYYGNSKVDGIDICVLTDGSEMSLDVILGGNWTTSSIDAQNASLDYNSMAGSSFIPLGSIDLPVLCITNSIYHTTLVEIKWMNSNNIVCRDTITLDCDNECGYLEDVSILCDGLGGWIFEAYIVNTSTEVMNTAAINFDDPGLAAYNQTISLGGLVPGGTYGPFTIHIGAPANGGDVLALSIILHALDHNDNHTDCCEFKYQLTLPECQAEPGCLCDADFKDQISLGAHIISITSGFNAVIGPVGNFYDCDKIIWNWVYQTFPTGNLTIGNNTVNHTFPGPGEYKYCMTFIRTQPDGKQCEVEYCGQFEVEDVELFLAPSLFPNPTQGRVVLLLKDKVKTSVQVNVYSYAGVKVMSQQLDVDDIEEENSLSLENLENGVYYVKIKYNENTHIKKIIIVK